MRKTGAVSTLFYPGTIIIVKFIIESSNYGMIELHLDYD